MKISSSIFFLLLAMFFIASGTAKLFPVEVFELHLYQQGFPWEFTTFFARMLVSVEWLVGLLLLLPWFKKEGAILAFVFLLITSGFLIVGLLDGRAAEDCGCFGNWMQMSFSWAIIRNGLMLLGVWFFGKQLSSKRKPAYWISALGLVVFVLVFILKVPDQWMRSSITVEKVGTTFPFSNIPQMTHPDGALTPLDSGAKQLVVFVTPGCSFCQKVTAKLAVLDSRLNHQLPLNFVVMGAPTNLDVFWSLAKAPVFPHTFLPAAEFLSLSGPQLPAVFVIENGIITQHKNYRDFNPDAIEDWWESQLLKS